MTTLFAAAPGKVNLCLFVGRPREDGLHPLVSVMQPVSLADGLSLEIAGERDEVLCPGVEGPNLAASALAAYRRAGGWHGPAVRLRIVKRVPVAAGMGGGSGDAAAALRRAAHAAGRPGDPILHELAMGLGADVPAQVEPRRCLVTGAGENVRPLEEGPLYALLVVPSPHALSTPEVFREADRMGVPRSPEELGELEQAVAAAVAGGGGLPPELAVNDLEPAARRLCPPIDDALADVRAAGADRVMVSGSGPTVFGVFSGAGPVAAAEAAASALRPRHPAAAVAVPVGPEFGAVQELSAGA